MPSKKGAGKLIEYGVIRVLFFLFAIIPFSLRARMCEGLGILIWKFSSKYRNLVLTNLAYAFPESEISWREDVTKKNFRILGRQLAEFIQTSHITDRFFERWFIAEPDRELQAKIYREGGIVILGHFGNWEWHGFLAGKLSGRPIFTLVKRHANWYMNRYIEKSRHGAHMKLIYIDQNPFVTINKLRKGELVAFTSDQHAGGSGEYFPFFGRLASTFLGPASVARHTKVPVYFVWSYHDDLGRLHFRCQEMKRPEGIDPGEQTLEWEKEFTYTWVKLLEEKVREHPADYLWTHNRWKSSPENPEEIWKQFPEEPVVIPGS